MDALLNRRQLLGASAAALLSGRAFAEAARAQGPILVGAEQGLVQRTGAKTFALRALAEDGRLSARIELPFHMHGFAGHPLERRYAAVFEKKGPGAAIVDLERSQVVQPLAPAKGRQFYGHGAYSPDGALLFGTETVPEAKSGVIAVRDVRAGYREIAHFASHGSAPHDCHLVDDGKVMVIAHGGSAAEEKNQDPPSVTWVDVKTEKLLDKLYIPAPHLNAGHLAIGKNGDVAVVSAPRKGRAALDNGGITLRPHGERAKTLSAPEQVVRQLVGEVLSVALHEGTRTIAATNPDGNLLTFWHVPQGLLRRSVTLEKPRGVVVTPDQRWFAVTHGDAIPRVSFFSTAELAVRDRPDIQDAKLTGSHIYNWAW
ncbi:MAG: DUF1513 domain-containing protein [Myxococcota bacterium]